MVSTVGLQCTDHVGFRETDIPSLMGTIILTGEVH